MRSDETAPTRNEDVHATSSVASMSSIRR
jgi:hypothetical protein